MIVSKMSRQTASKRIQMDMPPRSVERLKSLRDITEATSYSEVVRNALRLYEALIAETESQNKILIERDGRISEYKIFTA